MFLELLYIHSKVVIVDDRRVIVRINEQIRRGMLSFVCRWDRLKPNINDRSQKVRLVCIFAYLFLHLV